MSLNTADKIFLVVGLVDFAGIFIVLGICLHLAYTKMDLMLDHLQNSPMLSTLTTLRHCGPWGKLILVGSISGFVTFPNFYLKRGWVSAEDLLGFPAALKSQLVVLQWSALGLLLVMAGLAAVVKLGIV
ncbi:hypothetical protein C4K38_4449 [Pseudomonas chlororaphis subsp. piscium]|uniref:hypothetical protein n=1 Tax=Pseudomonas chlororaphis TaxID=587753 RepID=UPI0006A5CD34|nr:hypothetical protein [Pseudomonas chlororaphis]AZC32400.1 hypothetical protein C4K38_4449 [Pseudomonas chlororaphis subsp. piscium]WDG90117.1 hypothetical protein PUP49_22915 [Pseudomonas chlororaphis]SDS65335.1 hypothetical protein SAMN05216585_2943 [Pseudomonas chlororaphis]